MFAAGKVFCNIESKIKIRRVGKQTSSSARRERRTTAKKRRRRPNKYHRATTNSMEGKTNSKKHVQKRLRSTGRVQKRAQQGHTLQKARRMAGYATGTATDPKEEEEEDNLEGNHKQPATNSIGGSCGWEKESAARTCSERAGNLAGYATGLANEPEEEKEEEYAAGNPKQPARKPVGGYQGWENENEPTSAPSTLGIHGGAEVRFTKQETTLT